MIHSRCTHDWSRPAHDGCHRDDTRDELTSSSCQDQTCLMFCTRDRLSSCSQQFHEGLTMEFYIFHWLCQIHNGHMSGIMYESITHDLSSAEPDSMIVSGPTLHLTVADTEHWSKSDTAVGE